MRHYIYVIEDSMYNGYVGSLEVWKYYLQWTMVRELSANYVRGFSKLKFSLKIQNIYEKVGYKLNFILHHHQCLASGNGQWLQQILLCHHQHYCHP